jgi:Fe-S cluster biogenesis protein NfuA
VANEGEFQEQVRQLGKVIAQFDQMPESAAKAAGKEMVQLLMDVHGRGLERMMEIVFASGSESGGESGETGQKTIDKFGQDSIVGSLLLLYSLHPDDLETRVHKALARMRPRLRKLAYSVELVSIREDVVQVRLATSGHSCGSSTQDLRAIVEDGVCEFAPDVTSIMILGLDEPAAAGFVALESLLGYRFAAVASGHLPEGEGAD